MPMSCPSKASTLIKAKRQRLAMTQKELADAIGMPTDGKNTVSQWEKGVAQPSWLELKAILDFPEEPSFPNNPNGRYRLIDLFAGIGGTRIAFAQTHAVNVVFSDEFNPFSQKTYHANFGEWPQGDITQINERDIPDHDILVGGFPCQAFSLAGLRKGFDDVRGTLFFDIARILNKKRPKAFLLENVKNLRSHNGGKTFKKIQEVLNDLDYQVYSQVLAAREFGVPQNRERIYIVGFDKRQVRNTESFEYPTPPCIPTRLGDILEKNVSDKYTISDTLWQGHQRRKIENAAAGKGFGYSLFNEDSPYTSTISARYYKDGSEILIEQKGKNPRKLTPREAARLQGFPDNFIIPVSDSQAYKQFGNSVAIPVVHAIAKNIVEFLDKNCPK